MVGLEQAGMWVKVVDSRSYKQDTARGYNVSGIRYHSPGLRNTQKLGIPSARVLFRQCTTFLYVFIPVDHVRIGQWCITKLGEVW